MHIIIVARKPIQGSARENCESTALMKFLNALAMSHYRHFFNKIISDIRKDLNRTTKLVPRSLVNGCIKAMHWNILKNSDRNQRGVLFHSISSIDPTSFVDFEDSLTKN